MGDTLVAEKSYLRLVGMIAGNLGVLSPEVVRHYSDNADLIPVALQRGFVISSEAELQIEPAALVEKFSLLADLGIITVPEGYDHATCLASFKKRHQGGKKKSFYSYNDDCNDANFPNPTRVLKAGDKLLVSAWKQAVSGDTTSEERMEFLARQKSIHVGAQGLTHVFEQKKDQLPKGY